MRFFILFIFCVFAAGQNAHAKIVLQELGIEAQILESAEGISPCKAGGDIIRNLGKWLRLERDGKVFAQTCVYDNWNISLAEADGVRFYQVESSEGGQKLLSLLSDQGMTLHVFHTDGKGLKERRTQDGKLLYVWEGGDYDYTYETLVGKNEISTVNKTEQDGDPRWTNLTLEDLIYLGPDGKGMAGTGCGHLFRTKDGQELRLTANASGQNKFFWDWMLKRQGKPIRVQWGNYDIGPGFGGPSIYEAMPGLAQETPNTAAPYYNDRYGFALTWLPENCIVQESDSGDGATISISEDFTLLAYGTQSYAVMNQSMEDAVSELSQGLYVTYKNISEEKGQFVISGHADGSMVYIKCFFGRKHACIIRMDYPKDKAQDYASHVLKAAQGFQCQK